MQKKNVAFVKILTAKLPWWFKLDKMLEAKGFSKEEIEEVFAFCNEGTKVIFRDIESTFNGEELLYTDWQVLKEKYI